MMIEKEFVPYKEALALKELGFDQKCFGFYSPIHDLMICNTNGINEEVGECLAPLFQQAFRWFREEHNMDCHIEKDRKNRYWFNTRLYGSKKTSNFCYHRHEKAELACLRKLIEIVK